MQDNEKQPIFKGRITEFGPELDEFGAPVTARVVPITTPDAPTMLFRILYIARDPRCDLQVDTEVVCARFEDGTGIILCRADGDNTQHFPGDMYIDKGELEVGDVYVEESVNVEHNVNVDVDVNVDGDVRDKGTVYGDTQMVVAGIGLKGHTHTAPHGETTGPHGG